MWQNAYGEWEVSPVDCGFGPPTYKQSVEVEYTHSAAPIANRTVKVARISKREVMKLAHMIRRECANADWGLCLKEAWRLSKIAALEAELFMINMADMPHRWEKERAHAIEMDLRALRAA